MASQELVCGYGKCEVSGGGFGSGMSYGLGEGYGYFRGSGVGHGTYGEEYGNGSGGGSGCGYGQHDHLGCGVGNGDGSGGGYERILDIQEHLALVCYLCMKQEDTLFILPDGGKAEIGEHIHVGRSLLYGGSCHASFWSEEALRYASDKTVLTELNVWGHIRIWRNRIFATDRKIIRVLDERK